MRDLVRRYDEETERLADFYAHRLGTQAERMTSIQKEIRAIAEEFRIDPEAVDFTTEAMQGTGLTRFQISFPLTGGYPNLRQFISRRFLEAAPAFLAPGGQVLMAFSDHQADEHDPRHAAADLGYGVLKVLDLEFSQWHQIAFLQFLRPKAKRMPALNAIDAKVRLIELLVLKPIQGTLPFSG